MIYGRFGDTVTILRLGTLEDVRNLDTRDPDPDDVSAVKCKSYVVVQQDDGKERLYHLAYLRADGGSKEITQAIQACKNG